MALASWSARWAAATSPACSPRMPPASAVAADADRGDARLALLGRAVRRLARGLVAREAVGTAHAVPARGCRRRRCVAALHARDRDRALGAADGRGDGAAGLESGGAAGDDASQRASRLFVPSFARRHACLAAAFLLVVQ